MPLTWRLSPAQQPSSCGGRRGTASLADWEKDVVDAVEATAGHTACHAESPLTLLFQCFHNPDPEEQVWRLHVLLAKVQSQLTFRLRARDLAGDPSESWDERELVATEL